MIDTNLTKSKKNIPAWPNERDLSRYALYAQIDFNKELSDGKVWIDVGCRTGLALSQSRKLYEAILIGVNAHKIRVRKNIQSILTVIPDDREVYKKYRRKVHLLTDIHGAISYCENPLEALIYESCLLKSNAKAVMVTLEARLGNVATWKRIQHFYATIMKQAIKFEKFTTYSDNTKTPIKTLRITVRGHCQSKLKLEKLWILACEYIGYMKKTKVLAEAIDKSFQIWGVRYKKL